MRRPTMCGSDGKVHIPETGCGDCVRYALVSEENGEITLVGSDGSSTTVYVVTTVACNVQ